MKRPDRFTVVMGLVALVMAVGFGLWIWLDQRRADACEDAGGVYLYRERLCLKGVEVLP